MLNRRVRKNRPPKRRPDFVLPKTDDSLFQVESNQDALSQVSGVEQDEERGILDLVGEDMPEEEEDEELDDIELQSPEDLIQVEAEEEQLEESPSEEVIEIEDKPRDEAKPQLPDTKLDPSRGLLVPEMTTSWSTAEPCTMRAPPYSPPSLVLSRSWESVISREDS